MRGSWSHCSELHVVPGTLEVGKHIMPCFSCHPGRGIEPLLSFWSAGQFSKRNKPNKKKQHSTKFHSDTAQDGVLLPGWSAWYGWSTPAFECSAPSTPWDFTAASLSKTLPNTILPSWVSVVWTAALFGSCSPCLTVFFNHRQCVVCAKQNMEMTAAVK